MSDIEEVSCCAAKELIHVVTKRMEKNTIHQVTRTDRGRGRKRGWETRSSSLQAAQIVIPSGLITTRTLSALLATLHRSGTKAMSTPRE
jgi:hypothetical protein